ncbi:ribonuclease III [Pelagibacteraceae bacterium]|nr:ribonuclease III [Pelagibacteraceae bacterium]
MNIDYLKFEKKIKIKVKNKSLLEKALTHKSASSTFNNEKLEFLGDRVLGLVLSHKLYKLYPDESEGVLDKRFSKLVNKKTCCSIAWEMGLQNYIRLGDTKKKITRTDEKILSDACESLVGAVFLDQGYEFAKNFILNLWHDFIIKSNITILDSKTKLQEYSLKKYKKLPIYTVVDLKGPKHNPTFKVSVSIQGSRKFFGTGRSKQEAQQSCAKNLLKKINII